MHGNRIKLAKKALMLFIRSLPSNSLFNVVSFGSSYKLMFDQSRKYDDDTMQSALSNIETFSSDFGGTELDGAISCVLSQTQNHKYPRNVFVLTDGAISNTQTVLDIIEKHNHETRVHSFGIGSGASKYLVNEIAHSGKGTATHIAKNDKQISAKVIKALKHASKPAFTNVSIDWGKSNNEVEFSAPMSPYTSNIYEEEPFDLYAILSESKVEETELRLKFYNTYEQTDKEVVFKLDLNQIKMSDSAHEFQLAARRYIDFCDRFGGKESSETIIGISTEYQVLCSKTALFGKIKNKRKSKKKMKTIEIPVNKLDHNMRGYQDYGVKARSHKSKGKSPSGHIFHKHCKSNMNHNMTCIICILTFLILYDLTSLHAYFKFSNK